MRKQGSPAFKLLFALAFAFLALLCMARDLTTLSGKTFHDVSVIRSDPAGIEISHSSGGAYLSFEILDEAVRREFNYDPEKAKEFLDAKTSRQDDNERRLKESGSKKKETKQNDEREKIKKVIDKGKIYIIYVKLPANKALSAYGLYVGDLVFGDGLNFVAWKNNSLSLISLSGPPGKTGLAEIGRWIECLNIKIRNYEEEIASLDKTLDKKEDRDSVDRASIEKSRMDLWAKRDQAKKEIARVNEAAAKLKKEDYLLSIPLGEPPDKENERSQAKPKDN